MMVWVWVVGQAKYSRLFNLDGMSCFNQHNAAQLIWIPFRRQP